MRHEVGICEGQLDFLTCFHSELLHVVHHLFHHCSNPNFREFRGIGENARFDGGGLLFLHWSCALSGRGFEPVVLDDECGVACVRFGGFEELSEQRDVFEVMLLRDPESFEEVMSVLLFVGIKLLHPCG